MFPLFLLAVAAGIVAVALLFLFWRNMDQRVKMAYGDETMDDLAERLEHALEEQQHLTSRIENLEAIIAGEPWSAAPKQPAPKQSVPPLTLPGEEADAPSEERAGERRRSR